MNAINLRKIIDAKGLVIIELGRHLYPNNKQPYLAIRRVLTGEAFLNSEQLVKLSEYTGIPINFLFSFGKWEYCLKNKKVEATSGEIKAVLNTQTWETQLFKNGAPFLDPFKFAPVVELSIYLEFVTNLILKNK